MLEVDYEKTKLFQGFYCHQLRGRIVPSLLFSYEISYNCIGCTPDSGRLFSAEMLIKEATVCVYLFSAALQ
jgi:hypothetical protein